MPELRSQVVSKVMLWKFEKAYYVPNLFVQHMLLSDRCNIDKGLGYFPHKKCVYCSAVIEMPLNSGIKVTEKASILNAYYGIGNLGLLIFITAYKLCGLYKRYFFFAALSFLNPISIETRYRLFR